LRPLRALHATFFVFAFNPCNQRNQRLEYLPLSP
jgi:hypothetical protein